MVELKIKLPPDFLNEEVRDGYTVSPEMKQVWAVLLDLLNEFMRVCEKHKIRWYADAGTILGAVRHHGMIPWDDDIDVMMMRNEYNKLCAIAKEEFKSPYFFQTEYTDKGSLRGHAQLRNEMTTGILEIEKNMDCPWNQGIFLDIFPIDILPADEEERFTFIELLQQLKGKAYSLYWIIDRFSFKKQHISINAIKIFIKKLLSRFIKKYNYRTYYVEYEKEASKYNGTDSPFVAKLSLLPFKSRRLWRREWLSERVFLPFENMEIAVPIGYKELLKQFYGDWEKYVIGTSTHGGVFFDVDKPYTEYLK